MGSLLFGCVFMFGYAAVSSNQVFLVLAIVMSGLMLAFVVVSYLLRRREAKKALRRKRRLYRRHLETCRNKLAEIADRQRAVLSFYHPDPPVLVAELVGSDRRTWERGRDDADFMQVRVGCGPVEHHAQPRLEKASDPLVEPAPDLLGEAEALVNEWQTLHGLPVAVDLASAGVLTVSGPTERTRAWARSVVTQLAVRCAPNDLRMAVSCSEGAAEEWAWAKWLPHTRDTVLRDAATDRLTVVASITALGDVLEEHLTPRVAARHVLMAPGQVAEASIDEPEFLLVLDGFGPGDPRALPLLRDVMRDARSLRVSIIALVEDPHDEPSATAVRVLIDRRGRTVVEWTGRDGPPAHAGIDADQLTVGSAELAARALAPLRLDDGFAPTGSAPTLLELLGLDKVQDIDWEREWVPRSRARTMLAYLGLAEDGKPLWVDLKEHADHGMGPHGLIAGTNGSGKSELLKTMILSLAVTHSPEDLNVLFIDYKGGLAFDRLRHLPHCAGLITDLKTDSALARRARDALHGERVRRERLLLDAGVDDPFEYRRMRDLDPSLPPLPELVIVVDEWTELLVAQPDFLASFTSVGRVGRALGMHLVLCSQSYTVGRLGDLESNVGYRIALRVASPAESKALLGRADAFKLRQPGSGILQVADSVFRYFQGVLATRDALPASAEPAITPFGVRTDTTNVREPARERSDPAQLREILNSLSARAGEQQARQLWLEPLDVVAVDAITAEEAFWERTTGRPTYVCATVGMLDLPELQRQVPHVLDFSGAHVHYAVAGAAKSGKTTLLATLFLSLCRAHDPAEINLYAIDLGDGALRAFEDLPHVGAVALAQERDLVRQVISHVHREIDVRREHFQRYGIDSMADARERRAQGDPNAPPDIFLIIDGWPTLRQRFEALLGDVERIALEGSAFGVHLVAATDKWTTLGRLQDAFTGCLELRLADPVANSKFGQRGLPHDEPGRGLAGVNLEMRVALPRLDGEGDVEGLAHAVRAAVTSIAAQWNGSSALQVRPLPRLIDRREDTAAPDAPGVSIGVSEIGLEPVTIDLTGTDPHLLIVGDRGTGRTNLLRLFVQQLVRTHREATIAIVDPRGTLSDLRSYVNNPSHYASTAQDAANLATGIAQYVNECVEDGARITDGELTRTYLLIDDYDLLTSQGGPLEPLAQVVSRGRDVGLHLVLVHRSSEAMRLSFEPLYGQLCGSQSPAVLLSGDPRAGVVVHGERAERLPPGRGRLIHGGRSELVQSFLAEPASRPADAADDDAAKADA
jgi:S-DNA-T family DNA segregation ATPase FtsK/SpoIIIE